MFSRTDFTVNLSIMDLARSQYVITGVRICSLFLSEHSISCWPVSIAENIDFPYSFKI